jgi:ssDNA-binding Zn-finger/Zn-ribbon topoisomerase 1
MIFAIDEKKDLLYALKTFASITDMANFQEQKLLEIAKRAEKVRLEQEIVLAEQRIQLLKEQDYLVQESRRRNREQCLECGAPCVQRRRKSDGHLFFGCSKHFTTSCKGARSISCPKCGLEMIEKRRKVGGTFLGCTGWPGCNGSRAVDARLASERGVGTRNSDNRKSYMSKQERQDSADFMDDLTEALSHYPGSRSWWEEWGDRIHAEDPRERPQYYDVNFLNFLRDVGED